MWCFFPLKRKYHSVTYLYVTGKRIRVNVPKPDFWGAGLSAGRKLIKWADFITFEQSRHFQQLDSDNQQFDLFFLSL